MFYLKYDANATHIPIIVNFTAYIFGRKPARPNLFVVSHLPCWRMSVHHQSIDVWEKFWLQILLQKRYDQKTHKLLSLVGRVQRKSKERGISGTICIQKKSAISNFQKRFKLAVFCWYLYMFTWNIFWFFISVFFGENFLMS